VLFSEKDSLSWLAFAKARTVRLGGPYRDNWTARALVTTVVLYTLGNMYFEKGINVADLK
jgi:hypothetical protein